MSLVINHNMMSANVARSLNAHYGGLRRSTGRLSTGLRINGAADDAAGLAIREIQRAEIASLHQGARNINDAISLIQTADGALSVIDEKLIRMTELAEQAATGTYDAIQRRMIADEFHEMALEIERIAQSADFNGVKLLDGSLSGRHDGSGLDPSGALKIHFGPANDSAEDYYYVAIGDCTLAGLGLARRLDTPIGPHGDTQALSMLPGAGPGGFSKLEVSGIEFVGYIPAGSRNVRIMLDGISGDEDDIQIFTRDGYHLAGTMASDDPAVHDPSWANNGVGGPGDLNFYVADPTLGFLDNATTYKMPGAANETGGPVMRGTFNDGFTAGITAATWSPTGGRSETFIRDGAAQGMTIRYSGDFDKLESGAERNDGFVWGEPNPLNASFTPQGPLETLIIDEATEDLLLCITGRGLFRVDIAWDAMPGQDGNLVIDTINTQAQAQEMLERIRNAIVVKDNVRAHLGAMQNRLENSVTTIRIQAENLQAAESRISDVDVAAEMTAFARARILTHTAVAMLSQAGSLPRMALQLLGG